MPLYVPPPAQFRRATGSIPPPRLNKVRVESAVPSAFLLDLLGVRSESATIVPRDSGELYRPDDGDFVRKTVRVAGTDESHDEEVYFVSIGGILVVVDPATLAEFAPPAVEEAAAEAPEQLAQGGPSGVQDESATTPDPFGQPDSAQPGFENTPLPPEQQDPGDTSITEGGFDNSAGINF